MYVDVQLHLHVYTCMYKAAMDQSTVNAYIVRHRIMYAAHVYIKFIASSGNVGRDPNGIHVPSD